MKTPRTTLESFAALDIRVARVLSAERNTAAHKPAYILTLDAGPEHPALTSSARITEAYDPADLVGRLVMAVINLPPKRVAGIKSEALVLGVYSSGGDGPVVLIAPDAHAAVEPGDRLG